MGQITWKVAAVHCRKTVFLQLVLWSILLCFWPRFLVKSQLIHLIGCLIWLAFMVLWFWIHLTSLRAPKHKSCARCIKAPYTVFVVCFGAVFAWCFVWILGIFLLHLHMFRSLKLNLIWLVFMLIMWWCVWHVYRTLLTSVVVKVRDVWLDE